MMFLMKKGVLGTNCANRTNYGVPIKAPMKTKDDQKGEGKEDLLCIDILLVNALSLSMLSTTKKYIYRERDSDRQNLGPKECLDGEILCNYTRRNNVLCYVRIECTNYVI